MNATYIIHVFVLCVLLPMWLLLGLGDWLCHRRAHVETTAGPIESVIHLLLSGEAAAAILPGLFLEINALVLVFMTGMLVIHEFTTTWDVRVAFPARAFTITEQRIHDYLTAVPILALGLMFATHIDQVAGLIGLGDTPVDFHVRLKSPSLPTAYLASWMAAAALLNLLPFTEELWRGVKARGAGAPLNPAEQTPGKRDFVSVLINQEQP